MHPEISLQIYSWRVARLHSPKYSSVQLFSLPINIFSCDDTHSDLYAIFFSSFPSYLLFTVVSPFFSASLFSFLLSLATEGSSKLLSTRHKVCHIHSHYQSPLPHSSLEWINIYTLYSDYSHLTLPWIPRPAFHDINKE